MRRWVVLGTALGALAIAGCINGGPATSGDWLPRLRPFQGPVGPDVVQLDVALLERPVGDAFLNEELWQSADERVIGPEHRAVMEGSGFRIGHVNGPSKLIDLLAARTDDAGSRRRQMRAGRPWPLALGPAQEALRFQVEQDDDFQEVEFHKAECFLVVTAAPTKDGRTLLRLTPRIVHGEEEHAFRVTEDRSSLMLTGQRPQEDYPDLSWETTLGPNEYLVVGGRYDCPETLGHACFVRPDEKKPVQRLLVVRAGVPQREVKVKAQPLPGAREEERGDKVPTLAQQVSRGE